MNRMNTAIAVLAVLLAQAGFARADEIKVWTARAIATVLAEVGPQFERATGHKLVVTSDLAPPFVRRAHAGESFDLMITGAPPLDGLIKDGKIVAQSRTLIARSGIGVEVRAGAPKPDVSSVEAFKRALLDAKSIGYLKDVGSGIHVAGLVDRLGIAEAVRSKTIRPDSDVVSEMVARGEIELGMIVITQILTTPGVELVGPLPPELQSYVSFTAGISANAKAPEAARELIKFLTGPIAASVIKDQGMESGGAAQEPTFPEPRTLKINERVFVLLGPIQHANRGNQGYMINATLIVGDKGVILVDSGGSDEVGRHIAKAVRRITDKPVTHVVNTHHHGDHYLGNTAFPEATIISSEMCRKMVLETGSEWLGIMERDIGRKLPGTKPIAAGLTYREGTRTQALIHGVRIVFWVPRGSHTIGDLMVYLPDDRALIAGDVLVSRIVPTLQDGFVKNWIRTLGEMQALDVAHFVPGHGDVMALPEVTAMRDAILGFYSRVKEGFKRGESEDEIRKSLDLSAWNKLERSYVIGRNVNRAYLEIEADSFDE